MDFVGVEREPLLDHAHLVVGFLVRPDRVLRTVLEGVIRRRALEGAVGFVARADEPVHLHVLAREVVDDRVVAYYFPRKDVKIDRKSTRLNSSHLVISYAVFCLKKKKKKANNTN